MTKHELLRLLERRNIVSADDVEASRVVTGSAARAALHRLLRQGLVWHLGRMWMLTDRGKYRLVYFDEEGCGSPDCPWCSAKI